MWTVTAWTEIYLQLLVDHRPQRLANVPLIRQSVMPVIEVIPKTSSMIFVLFSIRPLFPLFNFRQTKICFWTRTFRRSWRTSGCHAWRYKTGGTSHSNWRPNTHTQKRDFSRRKRPKVFKSSYSREEQHKNNIGCDYVMTKEGNHNNLVEVSIVVVCAICGKIVHEIIKHLGLFVNKSVSNFFVHDECVVRLA